MHDVRCTMYDARCAESPRWYLGGDLHAVVLCTEERDDVCGVRVDKEASDRVGVEELAAVLILVKGFDLWLRLRLRVARVEVEG